MIINLLLNALICPFCVPNANNSLVNLFDGHFLSELFYTYPWVHSWIWCLMCFLLGGITSCLCLVSGTHFEYQVFTILTPFALYLITDVCLEFIARIVYIPYEFSPLRLIFASTGRANSEIPMLVLLGCLFVVPFIFGFWQVKRNELN